MRKITALSVSLFIVLLAIGACKMKVGGVAGKTQDLLTLIPKDIQGVILVDVQNGMKTEVVGDLIKKAESEGELQEFTQKTGIDPKKDVRFVAFGLLPLVEGGDQEGVGVINLTYNKDTLLTSIKRESEVEEIQYGGFTVYILEKSEGSQPTHCVFLDEANIIVGSPKGVEAVIDVFQGKKDNVRKNAELTALLKETNEAALIWGAFLIPAKAMQQVSGQVPMLGNIEGLTGALLSVDYQNKTVLIDIKAKGADEAKLKQMADMLNGIKAFAGMAAAEKPEIGEALNKVEISSGKDFVRLYANLPEDLIKKLVEEAATPKPQEEPKEEEVPQDQPIKQ